MPKQYPKQQRHQAVRMVQDHLDEYDSVYLACKAIAPKIGVGVESLRRWAQQAQVDAGDQPGRPVARRPGSRSWSERIESYGRPTKS